MKKIATIKIIDEINIVILGLTPQHYKHFYDKFGLYQDGYNFKKAYKLGRWDGKVRLFSQAGKTSIHYIEEIVPELKALGYKIKLADRRNPVTFDVPLVNHDTFSDYGIKLGDHQVEAINALIENRGGIAIAATGAGKSYVIGALFKMIADHMNMKCIAIVPTANLVIQTANEIKLFGNDVGMYYADSKELHCRHLVSTWQSLQNNPEILANYHAVIVDEAHGAKSYVLKNMLMQYAKNAVFIAGVTGTLPKHKTDMKEIEYVLGKPITKIEGRDLIDLGWLAALKLKTITLTEDFSERWNQYKINYPDQAANYTYKTFKSSYFPDYVSEQEWLKANKNRNLFLSYIIQNRTKLNGNTFVLVNGVAFGKRLAKLIPNSVFLHGADEVQVRKAIYDLYDSNDNMIVIATYKLASTGLNIKRIFNLFLIDPGKSFIQIIQSIGRGLRKASDKDSVEVWDVSSDLKYSKKHSKQRKVYYKEQRYHYDEITVKYSEMIDDIISGKEVDIFGNIVVY